MKVGIEADALGVFCDRNHKLKLDKLFDYMLESSMKQEDMLKDQIQKYNGAWIIYQWDVDIKDLPNEFDHLRTETYHTYTKKFYAFRNYDVYRDGELIVRAKSKWLMINKDKKIPMRVKDELGVIYDREDGYDYIKSEFEIPDAGYELLEEYKIRYADIDMNKHANNARYIEWIEGYIEDTRKIKRIEVIYKKELKLNDEVQIFKHEDNSNIYFKLISQDVLRTIVKIEKIN